MLRHILNLQFGKTAISFSVKDYSYLSFGSILGRGNVVNANINKTYSDKRPKKQGNLQLQIITIHYTLGKS